MGDYLTDEEKSELCIQCQACCKQLPMSLKHEPDSALFQSVAGFFLAHGCEAQIIQNTFVVSIPHVCQYLTEKGCAIYERRPQICQDYDGRKDPRLYNKCLWNKKFWSEKKGMQDSTGCNDFAEVKIV